MAHMFSPGASTRRVLLSLISFVVLLSFASAQAPPVVDPDPSETTEIRTTGVSLGVQVGYAVEAELLVAGANVVGRFSPQLAIGAEYGRNLGSSPAVNAYGGFARFYLGHSQPLEFYLEAGVSTAKVTTRNLRGGPIDVRATAFGVAPGLSYTKGRVRGVLYIFGLAYTRSKAEGRDPESLGTEIFLTPSLGIEIIL